MNLQETTIDAGEIAAALGLGRATFMRKVDRLVRMDGMPDRLPGRKRWSRIAIETWIRGYGDRTAARRADATATTNIATDRARLREHYVRNNGPRLVIDNERAGA